jgi:hypothetical protein
VQKASISAAHGSDLPGRRTPGSTRSAPRPSPPSGSPTSRPPTQTPSSPTVTPIACPESATDHTWCTGCGVRIRPLIASRSARCRALDHSTGSRWPGQLLVQIWAPAGQSWGSVPRTRHRSAAPFQPALLGRFMTTIVSSVWRQRCARVHVLRQLTLPRSAWWREVVSPAWSFCCWILWAGDLKGFE